jgi:hypothetical protein
MVEEKGGGDGGDPHRLQEGRWRGGNDGGGARCGRCLGAERREEGRSDARWRAEMAPLYIGAEGEAAVGD